MPASIFRISRTVRPASAAGRNRRRLVTASMRSLSRVFIVFAAVTFSRLDAQTARPAPSVPPPIVLPFPPLMQPPAGGLNSGSPFQPPPLGAPRDLFRVGSRDRVYTQRRLPFRLGYNAGFAYPSQASAESAPAPVEPIDAPIATPATIEPRVPLEPVPSAAPPASSREPMYIIPRCYVGNVPPRPDRLPPGCKAGDVKVINSK